MGTVSGFAPVANDKAIILILGSMPSIRSLQVQQYYAHPRNSFWFIMTQLLGGAAELDYNERKALLLRNGIALWDVLNSCRREGSLDVSIENATTVVNDFNSFFSEHPLIRAVFFNGARAQQEYNRQVLPALKKEYKTISCQRLPSTSPAMASLTWEQKLQEWKCIMEQLV